MADGVVGGAHAKPGRSDHLCWVYDDPARLADRAGDFLLEGLAAGERLEYLGEETLDVLHARLATLNGYDRFVSEGQLVVRSLSDLYGRDAVVDPAVPVAAYTAATEAALAAGFTGLRVVAEATPLVRTPAQREAFTRYEHLIDRYMCRHPFSAMCAYDVRALGVEAATEIACLHPSTSAGATSFRWSADCGADIRLAGEIDIASQKTFEATLERTIPLLARPEVVVDVSDLTFIDHRGLTALDDSARRSATHVSLRGAVPLVRQLGGMLDLQAVEVAR